MGRPRSQSQMPCNGIRAEDPLGHQGLTRRPGQGPAAGGFGASTLKAAENTTAPVTQRHGRGHSVRAQGEPQSVRAGDVEERGDVEVLARHGDPRFVGVQEIGVPLPVGVVPPR